MDNHAIAPPIRRPSRGGSRLAWGLLAGVVGVGVALLLLDISRTESAGGAAGGPNAIDPVTAPRSARVAGFNIRSARGDDDETDLSRVAAELEGVDLVVLNEVDYANSQGDDLARQLGHDLIPAPTERRWGAIDFGNAVLTNLPVESWAVFPLERTSGRGWRNVTLVHTKIGGERVAILGTHLDRGEDRLKQLDAVLDLFERLEPPVVLIGDLNSTSAEARLAESLSRSDVDDVLGRLAGIDSTSHIDWILLRGGNRIHAIAASHRPTPASDHPVVWADLAVQSSDPAPTSRPVGQ